VNSSARKRVLRLPAPALGGGAAALAFLLVGGALMGADLLPLVAFWAVGLVLAALHLPLVHGLLASFVDRGWPFARVLGLAIGGYLTWLVSSLGLAPFTRASCWLLILAVPAWIAWRARGLSPWRRAWGEGRRWIVAEEAAFLLVLLAWSWLRGTRPELEGLEKFMDFGFATAAARASHMPPIDPWLAGETINYYYFGQYLLAYVHRLSGIPLAVAYNLMLAGLAATVTTCGFSIAATLARRLSPARPLVWITGGLLGAALLSHGGNPHAFVHAVALPAAEHVGLLDEEFRSLNQLQAGHYWYTDATRLVGYNPPAEDKLIHEFPFYSFVVADLHSHVSDLPFCLFSLALVTALLAPACPGGARPPPRAREIAAAGGAAVGLMAMTHAWDVPIYAVLLTAALTIHRVAASEPGRRRLAALAGDGLALATVAGLVAFPFAVGFERHYGELALATQHTSLGQWLTLWGGPVALLALAVATAPKVGRAVGPAAARLARGPGAAPVLVGAAALGLLLLPELVFVKDIYPETYQRGNTYFKLTYQAFSWLALLSGVLGAALILEPGRGALRHGARLVAASVVLLPFVYTPLAVRGHYAVRDYQGLDGLAFLDQRRPGEGAAARWLARHAADDAVILEANGDSYTEYGRLSMATGVPTILGWLGHEWLWRGDLLEPYQRASEIQSVYETPASAQARAALERHRVHYVAIGALEREKFPKLDEAGVVALGRIVFQSGGLLLVAVEPES
jgi:uncharacterized membrane protein